jgi:purine nucleotide phosphorylase
MDAAAKALATIRSRVPDFAPRVGIVLGSGLGDFAAQVEDATAIPYRSLPGFPQTTVGGHAGRLVAGTIGGTPVAVMQGRAHYYEHGEADAMKLPIRTLAALGCTTLLLTNAAGSLRPEMQPGAIMAIADHINFVGVSPLFGEAGDGRFLDMTAAYDEGLRVRLGEVAQRERISLLEGTYAWFCGPNFETPAEVRAARALGADAVGMSTVPEVILARHAGLKVAALSIIANMAAGLSATALSHEQTLRVAGEASVHATTLITGFLTGFDG